MFCPLGTNFSSTPRTTTEKPEVMKEIDRYFLPDRGSLSKYSDKDIQRVSELLRPQNLKWSGATRLYIVFRVIGHLDVLDSVIAQGVTDLWFPFSAKFFPLCVDQNMCKEFLEAQWIVLTNATDFEKEGRGRHQSFAEDGLIPFRSHGFLGDGGYSRVDKIASQCSGTYYARKRIRRGDTFHRALRNAESFLKELQILKMVQHHHIVELLGSYTDPAFVTLILSPVADANLMQFWQSPLSSNKSLIREFFGCLLSVLSYLHSMKIRHRDIKPENILVIGEKILLTDFNVSTHWRAAEDSVTNDTNPLMTPRYGAPEMLDNGPRGSASDIWSLGCVFLEMVTILKGKDLSDMRAFFENHGSKSIVFAKNLDGIRAWIANLRTVDEQSTDNLPLKWIQQMLRKTSAQPLAAETLAKEAAMAGKTEHPPVTFCGLCCRAGKERSTKVQFSNIDTQVMTTIPIGESPYISQHTPPSSPPPSSSSLEATLSSEELLIEGPSYSTIRELPLRSSRAALFATIRRADAQGMSLLIDKGVSVESGDCYGRRALFKAVESGNDAIVSILLAKGAEVNAKTTDGLTALHEAAQRGLVGVMKLLIEKGADANIRSSDGRTALHLAVLHEKPICVQELVGAGADLDTQRNGGYTPLHEAAWVGNAEITKMLLDGNAKPSLADNRGSRPIHLAAVRGYDKVVVLLANKGADVNDAESSLGFNPLMLAADLGHEAVVKLLLERGANREYVDPVHGASALHLAARSGHAEIVQVLTDADWPVNATNKYGYTPLIVAAYMGSNTCLQVLLDSGADMDIPAPGGVTVLHCAALEAQAETVILLINNGADVHACNANGLTALHAASEKGHAEVAKVLLKYGADPNAASPDGLRPIDLAEAGGYEEVVELLESVSKGTV
ncbi:MAG: hypothetical protein M1839_005012 [Geoglossum umbratile]|nr:MAG: hypothetical protein M1839_005012 [Geoglossum umbratile]